MLGTHSQGFAAVIVTAPHGCMLALYEGSALVASDRIAPPTLHADRIAAKRRAIDLLGDSWTWEEDATC